MTNTLINRTSVPALILFALLTLGVSDSSRAETAVPTTPLINTHTLLQPMAKQMLLKTLPKVDCNTTVFKDLGTIAAAKKLCYEAKDKGPAKAYYEKKAGTEAELKSWCGYTYGVMTGPEYTNTWPQTCQKNVDTAQVKYCNNLDDSVKKAEEHHAAVAQDCEVSKSHHRVDCTNACIAYESAKKAAVKLNEVIASKLAVINELGCVYDNTLKGTSCVVCAKDKVGECKE